MSRCSSENLKKEVQSFSDKFFSKITPNGARVISTLVVALVLILFLATQTGRNIVAFVGYIAFALLVLFHGYRFYKCFSGKAKGIPKQKKVENDIMPEPTDTEPEVPDDSVEFKPAKVHATIYDDTNEVQLTIDDAISENEKMEHQENVDANEEIKEE